MSSLHSTMICFDNSDFMRNEDYMPSRLHSQMDSVQMLCRSKIRAHPQNEVGLMTISDKTEVLSTLTNNIHTVFTKLNLINPKGPLNLLVGLRIAHLVLRNRQQKDHKMRITAFVGSPIHESLEEFVQLAKKFKKEKVYVDIVLMGEYKDNENKLTSFINTLNGSEVHEEHASHLVIVPPGVDMSNILMNSALLPQDSAGTIRSPDFLDEDDADLALALRISLEEQRALEAEQRRQVVDPSVSTPNTDSTNNDNNNSSRNSNSNTKHSVSGTNTPATSLATASLTTTNLNNLPNFENMTEEEMIAFALSLSAEEARQTVSTPPQSPPPLPPKKESKKNSKK